MTGTHILMVNVPSVPHGPVDVTPEVADAAYYRQAATNIRYQAARGQALAGSNVTEAVAKLCEATAEALEAVSNEGKTDG